MTECVVCFEKTIHITECGHFVCKSCRSQLQKSECPYCRKYIKTWNYKDIDIPFYYFVKWFDSIYKKNSRYNSLKVGIEDPEILHDNMEYIFFNEFAECSWTENYEKVISLRIFNVTTYSETIRIDFCVPGVDSKKESYDCSYHPLYSGMENLYWWVKQKIPELQL